jgi:hypothetical protein
MTGRRTAILIVNGYQRRMLGAQDAIRYPWIELCLREVRRRSRTADYEVLVLDNSQLEEHRAAMNAHEQVRIYDPEQARHWARVLGDARLAPPEGRQVRHALALDFLVSRTGPRTKYLITLDTDAFPIRNGWIETLTGILESGAAVVGVYRDEMAPRLRPFIHVSCLCIRRRDLLRLGVSFASGMAQDVGQNLTRELRRIGRPIVGLRRSNARDFHFLIGGIYGDLIYHHGAGSRRARFWTSTDLEADERIRVVLREAAFRDVDQLVAVLRGEAPNTIGLRPVAHRGGQWREPGYLLQTERQSERWSRSVRGRRAGTGGRQAGGEGDASTSRRG